MYRKVNSDLQSAGERRRSLLCLALVAALLYNPFLTILSNSIDMSVRQPLSYRATVASSELRRCTLETEKLLIPALVAVVFSFAAGLASFRDVGFIQPSDSIAPRFTAASDGIWFRPPPTR